MLESRAMLAVIPGTGDPSIDINALGLMFEGDTLDLQNATFLGNADGVTFAWDFNGDGTYDLQDLDNPATSVTWEELIELTSSSSSPINNGNLFSEYTMALYAIKDGDVLEFENCSGDSCVMEQVFDSESLLVLDGPGRRLQRRPPDFTTLHG